MDDDNWVIGDIEYMPNNFDLSECYYCDCYIYDLMYTIDSVNYCTKCFNEQVRCEYCSARVIGRPYDEKESIYDKYYDTIIIDPSIKLDELHNIRHHCNIPIKNKYMNINIK